jgi:PAS domain S-box-containing protein
MDDRLTKLKEAAEKAIDESSRRSDDVPLTDFNRIIHHLKLYLTELEFQNKELQQTQNQLKNSESRYAQLYNQAPVGYVTLNSNSIIVQANQTFADMVNTDSSQILNSSLSDFMGDSDRVYFHTHFQAFFNNPADKSMELKMFKRDGAPFFARITGNLKSNDSSETDKYKQPKLFLIISDITKQKIAEDLLIEREYSYRTLADSGQALIWSSDTNKQYNYFNNVWLNFTGRSLEMELGNGRMIFNTAQKHTSLISINRNRSTWNTACETALVNIAGYWIKQRQTTTPKANLSGTSVTASIFRKSKMPNSELH